jgi:ribonuclease HI
MRAGPHGDSPDEHPRRTFSPGEVLAVLASTLDVDAVLARFPGLTRDQLRRILAQAGEAAPGTTGEPLPAGGAGGRAVTAPGHSKAWPKEITAYIDGAARGNPGEAGAGVLLQDRAGVTLEEIAEYLGRATNNTAEYRALLRALERAREVGATHLRVFSDSELLVNQVNGRYRTSAPHLQKLLQDAIRLMREIGRVDVAHVRREQNAAADALANAAIDGRRTS